MAREDREDAVPDFGAAVKAAREALGLNQPQLADKIAAVNLGRLIAIEQGGQFTAIEQRALCNALLMEIAAANQKAVEKLIARLDRLRGVMGPIALAS